MHEQIRSDDSARATRRAPDGDRASEIDPNSSLAGNAATAALLKQGGTALPPDLRNPMQRELGTDLGDVRVHTGAAADRAANDLDAVAFTRGNDVVLGASAPPLSSAGGNALLAHELTHVVQQRNATHVVDGVSAPGDVAEHAADAHNPQAGGTVHAVQRQAVIGKEQLAYKREEVQSMLADYLEQVLGAQGRRTIEKTPQVIEAISALFRGDPVRQASVELWLKGITDGTPAGLARDVAAKLPAVVPERNLDKIRGAPKKASPDTSPKTAGDAAGSVVVDSTVVPLVRRLGLSKDLQEKVIDAARSAVGKGIIGILGAALDGAGVAGANRGSILSAAEAAIKQQPGKPGDRQQDGAGSPYAQVQPPSVAPPSVGVPGQQIFKLPAIPFDVPGTKPPPKPAKPLPKTDPAVDTAAAAVDPKAIAPDGATGDAAAAFGDARDFARDVARKLDDAQAKKNAHLMIDLGLTYANADRAGVFARMKQIVLSMRDALPHHAALVERVTFTMGGKIAYSFPLH